MTKRKNIETNNIEELKKDFISALEPSVPELFPTVNFLTELVSDYVQKMIDEKNEEFLELSENYDSSSFNDRNMLLFLFSNFSYSRISIDAMQNHIMNIYIQALLSDDYLYSRFIYLAYPDNEDYKYYRFNDSANETDNIQRVSSLEIKSIINEIDMPIPAIELQKSYLFISGYDIANDVTKIMRIINQTYFDRTGKYIIPPISQGDIERANYLNKNLRYLSHDEHNERFYLNRYLSFCFDEL